MKFRLQQGDMLRKFDFVDLPVRGELVRLDHVWSRVRGKDDYPGEISAVLGEALAASVLMAASLKFDGLLTLQLTGDGPMHLLVVQCSHRREVRGLAKWRGDVAGRDFASLAGSARMAITIETGAQRNRYQGIVPVLGDSLAEGLEAYFAQSVQVPTRIRLNGYPEGVAGLLLQRVPEARDDEAQAAWQHVRGLADALAADELSELSDEDLLRRLFAQEDLRVYEPGAVKFRCSCSRSRVETTLKTLGQTEIRQLLAEHGHIEVRCEFCNERYLLQADEAVTLFDEARALESPPIVH